MSARMAMATVLILGTLLALTGGASPSSPAAGSLHVSIHEWDLPTPGSLPHDPAVGPDGFYWYTAQKANRLGRLDPATGEITEFKLPTPDSGPHGLAADRSRPAAAWSATWPRPGTGASTSHPAG